jgi:UDP-2-acetamido-3-amino-2,3-dideoxy-glucuronate N-acetyltransferase
VNYQAHETAVIDEGARIGAGTKIWHFSHIMPGAVLGERCNIGQNVVVSPGVVLGANVKVQNNVSIYEGVTCDDDVFLGPSCVFTNVTNPRSAINRRGQYARTHVGRGASIGANATIVCGHDIGPYAFIGAGAVVTKNVPAYALVVGNPARQMGWMSAYGHRLEFNQNGRATCPESGEAYKLTQDAAGQPAVAKDGTHGDA